MECPACLGTCEGECPVCSGSCGAGKRKAEKQVCMPRSDYLAEHKELIALLERAGKEGKKQKAEVKSRGGCGECEGEGLPGIEAVILDHFKRGHTLEDLLVKEDGPKAVFNINSHGTWNPSKQEVDKLNKQFLTFRFTTSGKLMAVRGRQFARDADVLIKRLKAYELDQY